jgi:hypothetical protein
MDNIQLTVKHNIGNTIAVSNDMVLRVKTYLSDNYGVGSTAINVDNAQDFLTSNIALFEGIGQERAEFKAISNATNTQITVAATIFAHNRGSSVYLSQYDQIVVEKASSLGGVYSVLGTYLIQATQQNTLIQDNAGLSTSYYRVKFRNSVNSLESAYSVEATSLPFGSQSIASMFQTLRQQSGIAPSDPVITTPFLIGALNDAKDYVKNTMAGFKQGWLAEFEYPIQMLAGRNFVELPDNYDYNFTNNALLSVRYPRVGGLAPYPLAYVDKREWNNAQYGLKYTYTSGATLSGSTTLTVTNIGDFGISQTGTIFVATENFSQSILQVNYTGVDLTTNTFTGCTGITRNIGDNVQVFAFPTFAISSFYTVFDNKIVFNRPIAQIMQGQNVYIDYYKAMDYVTDINEILDEPYKDIYKYYIRYAIKYARDNSIKAESDPDFKMFANLVNQWVDNHYIGQMQKVIRR